MSETKSNPIIPVAPKPKELPTRDALKAKLTALEAAAMKYAGNANFNPFLWVAKNLSELIVQLKTDGPVTSGLVAKIEAIKLPEIK